MNTKTRIVWSKSTPVGKYVLNFYICSCVIKMGFPHDIEQLITRSKLMNNELFIRKKCFEVLKKKKQRHLTSMYGATKQNEMARKQETVSKLTFLKWPFASDFTIKCEDGKVSKLFVNIVQILILMYL